MIAAFLAKSGHVASVPLQERKTVNTEWYINTFMPKVFETWSARRPNTGTRGLLPLTTAATLEENLVQMVTHPPPVFPL